MGKLKGKVRCRACKGLGYNKNNYEECEICAGEGVIFKQKEDDNGDEIQKKKINSNSDSMEA